MSVSNKLKGRAASPGIVQGQAFVIGRPSVENVRARAFPKEGAVLVTRMTSPDLLPLMVKSVAVVTEVGGITCHAAIVAREFGIPCVVGVGGILKNKKIRTGTRLIVDGSKGTVEVVDILEE